jgi:bacterioferritin (cytochrome b1)
MIKMIDVLEHNLVQNFIHSLSAQTEHLDELIEGILQTSHPDVTDAINNFLNLNNTSELAEALDIQQDRIEAIQSGLAMKKENIADTAKIVALCLALETNALDQVDIADSLEDYPI